MRSTDRYDALGARHALALAVVTVLAASHFLGCGSCDPSCNCDSGGCFETCADDVNNAALSCVAGCNGGLCKQSVTSYSTEASCGGGKCAQSCAGHDCLLSCDGGGCRQDCEADLCDVTCDGGGCLCVGKGCP